MAVEMSAINRGVLYVSMERSGLLKSSNGGQSRETLNSGIDFRTSLITYILEHPFNGRLYVLDQVHGLLESPDDGATWRVVRKYVDDARVDPRRDGVFYVDDRLAGTMNSTDDGSTWNRFAIADFRDASFPEDTLRTFVAVRYPHEGVAALLQSRDGGRTWENLTSGTHSQYTGPYSIAVVPTNPDWILFTTADGTGGMLWRSTNGGTTWSTSADGIEGAGQSPGFGRGELAFSRHAPDSAYVIARGVLYQSLNGGATWNAIRSLPAPVHHLSIDASGQYIIASSGRQDHLGGIFQSTDGGLSWEHVPVVVPDGIPPDIGSVDASHDEIASRLYVEKTYLTRIDGIGYWTTGLSLFATSNEGLTWHQAVNQEHLKRATFLGASSQDTSKVYMYVSESPFSQSDGWLARVQFRDGSEPSVTYLRTVASSAKLTIAPSHPDILYLEDQGYWRSDDGGQYWSQINSQSMGALRIHPLYPNLLFALRSFTFYEHYGLNNVYQDRIAFSANGGKDWENIFDRAYNGPSNRPWKALLDVVPDPNGTVSLYALFEDQLLRTTDRGSSWEIVAHDSTAGFREVAVDFKQNVISILRGSKDILTSSDSGRTWNSISTSLPVARVNKLSVNASGGIVVATNKGLFRYAPVVSVQRDEASRPTHFVLHQNHPNPFNPATEIRYQISEVSRVTLKVYDVLGREVAMLVNGEREAGTHRVRWDARLRPADFGGQAAGLPSGVYFYRLKANGFVETRKMNLAR